MESEMSEKMLLECVTLMMEPTSASPSVLVICLNCSQGGTLPNYSVQVSNQYFLKI